jgi:hypothetical protein
MLTVMLDTYRKGLATTDLEARVTALERERERGKY